MMYVTEHMLKRLDQRLKRKIAPEDYLSLYELASEGYVTARRGNATHRVIRFKRKWMLVVLDELNQCLVTCWRPNPKIIEKARLAR